MDKLFVDHLDKLSQPSEAGVKEIMNSPRFNAKFGKLDEAAQYDIAVLQLEARFAGVVTDALGAPPPMEQPPVANCPQCNVAEVMCDC